MKLFLKIFAGFLAGILIIGVGFRIYFSDERLRETVIPVINESLGSEVEIASLSLSIWSSLPDAGVRLEGFKLPDSEGNTIATLEELVFSVRILPLISGKVQFSEVFLNSPEFTYVVGVDSTSNIDFILDNMSSTEGETEQDESGSLTIPKLVIQNGNLRYTDKTSGNDVHLKGLDGEIGLEYDEQIQTQLSASVSSLSVVLKGEDYINDLQVELIQSSTLEPDKEVLQIQEGKLGIRNLDLGLSGSLESWSKGPMMIDLRLESASDNFGELLGLIPPEYEEYVNDLETRGTLSMNGTIKGEYGEDRVPDFEFRIEVEDGYLKNSELPEAVRNVQLSFIADNNKIAIQQLSAVAAGNTFAVNGQILQPMSEDPKFDLNMDASADLSTVHKFYPIKDLKVERMAGQVEFSIQAEGSFSEPDKARLNGKITLRNGMLQYLGVTQPVQNISAEIQASNNLIRIVNAKLSTSANNLSLSGTVNNPLDTKKRSLNLQGDLRADLSTVKEFYPLDDPSLEMKGILQSKWVLRGRLDPFDLQELLQRSTVTLKNGYLTHKSLGRPLTDISFQGTVSGKELEIGRASFRSGQNDLVLKGKILRYMTDTPQVNLSMNGNTQLADIENYYSLKAWLDELNGTASMNLSAKGPLGDPLKIQLNGSLELDKVNARGGTLPLPVKNLKGRLSVTPTGMQLKDYQMQYGASDIQLSGELKHYLSLLRDNEPGNLQPSITGTYKSNLLDLDEMIDWEAEIDPNEPIPIHLPDLNAQVNASIAKMKIMGVTWTNVSGRGMLNPTELSLNNAKLSVFSGTVTGNLKWRVPKPLATSIHFEGSVNNVEAQAFFKETGFLGENNNLHQYLEGALSSNVKYVADLDKTLSPVPASIVANGTFGMTKSRLKGHPLQMEIAKVLKAKELENMALDSWNSSFTIKDQVMTLKDLKITSNDIGMELNGTHHLVNDKINYDAKVTLPGRFKKGIASVITDQAANALEQDNGTIAIPLLITGTSKAPRVRPNENVIKDLVKEYLKKKGGNLIKNLFDGGGP